MHVRWFLPSPIMAALRTCTPLGTYLLTVSLNNNVALWWWKPPAWCAETSYLTEVVIFKTLELDLPLALNKSICWTLLYLWSTAHFERTLHALALPFGNRALTCRANDACPATGLFGWCQAAQSLKEATSLLLWTANRESVMRHITICKSHKWPKMHQSS